MTTYIPMPIVTGGTSSRMSQPAPGWLNITAFIVLTIVIATLFGACVHMAIEAFKEKEKAFAIFIGAVSLMMPLIEAVMIWMAFGR